MTNEFDKFCRKIIKEAVAMTPSGIEAKQQFFLHMADKYQNKIKRIHARMNNFVQDEQDTSVFKKLEKQLKMSMTNLKRAEQGFSDIDINKYGQGQRNFGAKMAQFVARLKNPQQFNKIQTQQKRKRKPQPRSANEQLRAKKAQAETTITSPKNNNQIWGQEEMEHLDRRYKEIRQQNIKLRVYDVIKQLAKEMNRTFYSTRTQLNKMRKYYDIR